MTIDPSRFLKLKCEGVPYKNIARLIHKRTHTVKSWLGVTHYERRIYK
jgi:DNA-directed RNA polymerase specialized sigma24 family protein